MRIILIMSLTGSLMVIATQILNPFIEQHCLFSWRSLLLKAAAVYYLVPMHFIRLIYLELQHLLIPELPAESETIIINRNRAAMLFSDVKKIMNIPGKVYLAVTAVWLIAAFFLLVKYIYQYRKYMVLISREFPRVSDTDLFALSESLKKEIKLSIRIRLYTDPWRKDAFTIGVLCPIIVFPANMDKEKLRLILLHKLIHIKNKDALVRGITLLILSLHWFNPIVYLFFKMINESNEICCDDKVAKVLEKKECQKYCELIVEMATNKQQHNLFVSPIESNYKVLKRRLIYLMNEKRVTKTMKYLTSFISVLLIFCCSLNVFAYGEPIKVMNINGQPGFIEEQLECFAYSDIAFAEKGVCLPFEQNDRILFEEQFIDEDGNIYEADKSVAGTCAHTSTVDGTYQRHEGHKDGSCTIENYSARRCTECGTVFVGNLISETNFPKCIH